MFISFVAQCNGVVRGADGHNVLPANFANHASRSHWARERERERTCESKAPLNRLELNCLRLPSSVHHGQGGRGKGHEVQQLEGKTWPGSVG